MTVSLSKRNAIGIALSKMTFLLLICWSLTPKLYWSISSKYAAGLMIVSFIGILLSTNVSIKDIMRYAVSYLAAILLTLYVWYFVRRSYYSPFLYVANGIVVWYPVVFSRHLIQMKDDRFNKVVLTTVVLCLLITGITTIIGQLEYLMASRLLAGGGDINDLEFFSKMNIGGYSYIYAAVLSIPYLIFLISPQQRKKNIALSILSFLTLIVIVGAIYLSQYYIALVLMLAVLLVTFIALAFASKLKRIEPFLSVRKRGLSVVIIG